MCGRFNLTLNLRHKKLSHLYWEFLQGNKNFCCSNTRTSQQVHLFHQWMWKSRLHWWSYWRIFGLEKKGKFNTVFPRHVSTPCCLGNAVIRWTDCSKTNVEHCTLVVTNYKFLNKMDLDHEVTVGVMFCCFCIVLLHFK